MVSSKKNEDLFIYVLNFAQITKSIRNIIFVNLGLGTF